MTPRANSVDLVPSPPRTEYSSSASHMFGSDADSDSDDMSAPPSPTPCPKKLVPSVSLPEASQLPASGSSRLSSTGAPIKRTFTERMGSSPPVSPEKKKKRASAIRNALQKSPKGLIKFFKKCTPTEHDEQVRRATEEENERYAGQEEQLEKAKAQRTAEIRENARL